MAKFKAGDICVGQNFYADTKYNGMECRVIGESRAMLGGVYGYVVLWKNGQQDVVPASRLRLKPARSMADYSMRDWNWAIGKVNKLISGVSA